MALFNDKYITGLKSKDKEYFEREDKQERKGGRFAVRVFPNGTKHFYFIYYFENKRKLLAIGEYGKTTQGKLSLSEAREYYAKYARLLDSGKDPKYEINHEKIEQKIKQSAELAKAEQERLQGSIFQLVEYYLDYLAQNSGSLHVRNTKQAFNKDLFTSIAPNTKANQINKDHIILVLHQITTRGSLVMANRMRAYLSALFQYGLFFDDSTESLTRGVKFYLNHNPVHAVKKVLKNEKVGDRSLNDSEIFAFWQALENSKINICRMNVFKLLLITGQRVEEVAGMTWDEIDLKDCLWSLPSTRTKNKRSHIVPLNQVAIKIIRSTPKYHDKYVFPGQELSKPLPTDGFAQALSRLLENTNIDKFVPRDLRRTFKTLTGKAGISKDVRDRLQNHALTDVSSLHYDKYDYLKEKREAMKTWNDYLENILSNEISP
jgi:integrase